MSIPGDVRAGVETALIEHGLGRRVQKVTPVGGGCINNGARIATDSGRILFLKWNASAPADMFEAEADGLRALAAASTLRVPSPIAWGAERDGTSWLLMEHVDAGQASHASLQALGRGLAVMHAHAAGARFGWERDNWIGSLDQANEPLESWGEFWRDRRIEPQLRMARGRGLAQDAAFDALLDRIPGALDDVRTPGLLHGDLWAGNWFADEVGRPVLVDPAVYRGHGEVDLAMSELFGGFGRSFYQAYEDALPMDSAYAAYRRDMYQLYYLLVHVNLFGRAYESGSLAAARRVLAELG